MKLSIITPIPCTVKGRGEISGGNQELDFTGHTDIWQRGGVNNRQTVYLQILYYCIF